MRKLKAFTLFEALIYMALFGLVFIGMLEFALSMSIFNRDAESAIAIQKTLVFMNEHISESFTNGQSINTTQSVFNNNSGKLVLNRAGGTYTYDISGGRARFNDGAGNVFLSPIDVQISTLRFEEIKVGALNTTIGVKVSIDAFFAKQPSVIRKTITSYVFQ